MRATTSWDDRPAGSPPPFAPMTVVTRVSSRSPEWKSHTSVGHARRALSYHRHGDGSRQVLEVWELGLDGAWNLLQN